MNDEKGFNKSVINWLACIYGVHQLNLIKWGFLRNKILQVLIKVKKEVLYGI